MFIQVSYRKIDKCFFECKGLYCIFRWRHSVLWKWSRHLNLPRVLCHHVLCIHPIKKKNVLIWTKYTNTWESRKLDRELMGKLGINDSLFWFTERMDCTCMSKSLNTAIIWTEWTSVTSEFDTCCQRTIIGPPIHVF